jgi:sensor histidine kinase regulating citrate/malate metabolism
LELKDRIGIRKTENDNIGIGLASSREICKKMGGDIKLKLSRKGLTIFSFKIPIQLAKIEEENEINYNVVATNPMEFYN